MTMSREEKMAFRKQQEEMKEIKLKREQAEMQERQLLQQKERQRREAMEARSAKNREVTPWQWEEFNLCELDDEISDRGEVIRVLVQPFPLRTATTSFPEARSKLRIFEGTRAAFSVEVLSKGAGPWSIGVVVADSVLPGEYWGSGEERVNLIWYLNSRSGNTYNGNRLLYFTSKEDSSRFYGPSGWTEGHEFFFNSVDGFSLAMGDVLELIVDLESELGTITFYKNGIELPNRFETTPENISSALRSLHSCHPPRHSSALLFSTVLLARGLDGFTTLPFIRVRNQQRRRATTPAAPEALSGDAGSSGCGKTSGGPACLPAPLLSLPSPCSSPTPATALAFARHRSERKGWSRPPRAPRAHRP